MGWERPNWYARAGMTPAYEYTYGRQNWFPWAAEEHRAVREAVGLFDQSSFAKLRLEGPDAADVLDRLCANAVDVPVGRIVYTQMLNRKGGIECDLTVTRLARDAFLIVTSASAATHDEEWIRRHLGDARAVLTDVTSAQAVLGVDGAALPRPPRSAHRGRSLERGLPLRDVAGDLARAAPVRATRITYVGELGWELYVPTEFAVGLHDALVTAGEDLELRHAGYHAMDSLRMEKAYRSWGHDLGSDDTPLAAGLDFAVRLDKRPTSSAGKRSSPSASGRSAGGWPSSSSRVRSRCCTGTNRSGETASSWGGRRPGRMATRSGARWVSATWRMRTG